MTLLNVNIKNKDLNLILVAIGFSFTEFESFFYYGAHSVPKPFNKLNHLANKINQFSVFNEITLSFII